MFYCFCYDETLWHRFPNSLASAQFVSLGSLPSSFSSFGNPHLNLLLMLPSPIFQLQPSIISYQLGVLKICVQNILSLFLYPKVISHFLFSHHCSHYLSHYIPVIFPLLPILSPDLLSLPFSNIPLYTLSTVPVKPLPIFHSPYQPSRALIPDYLPISTVHAGQNGWIILVLEVSYFC